MLRMWIRLLRHPLELLSTACWDLGCIKQPMAAHCLVATLQGERRVQGLCVEKKMYPIILTTKHLSITTSASVVSLLSAEMPILTAKWPLGLTASLTLTALSVWWAIKAVSSLVVTCDVNTRQHSSLCGIIGIKMTANHFKSWR